MSLSHFAARQGFVPLVSVCGVYLLFAGVVGCGVAAVRYNQVTCWVRKTAH